MSECLNRDANVLKLHERQKRSHFPQLMKTAFNSKNGDIQSLHTQRL